MHGTKLMCSTMVNIGQLRFSTCTLSTCEILYVRGPTFDFLFNCLHDHFQPGSFYLFICLVYVIFPMHLVQSFLLRPLVRYSLHRTSTVYCTSSLFVLQRWNYGARVVLVQIRNSKFEIRVVAASCRCRRQRWWRLFANSLSFTHHQHPRWPDLDPDSSCVVDAGHGPTRG